MQGALAYELASYQGEAILALIERKLQQSSGLSEYELLKQLREHGYFSFLGAAPAPPHALFCAHFLLYHNLYRLRDRALQRHEGYLQISALDIRFAPIPAAEPALVEVDPLRAYYLALENLAQTTEEDVEALLASFWFCVQNQQTRVSDLQTLGLSEPVSRTEIKQAYKRLAMQHHPDRGGDRQLLQTINQAYSRLLTQLP